MPPCFHMALLDDRRVLMHDVSVCGAYQSTRFHLAAACVQEWINWPGCCTDGKPRGYPSAYGGLETPDGPLVVHTDDPAEAEAAFERGERWVCTGELP